MNKKNIFQEFNPKLSSGDLELIHLFDSLENKDGFQRDYISKLDKILIKNLNSLRERIVACNVKVNTAIFGNKKFINESYAYEVPIRKEYFDNNENINFNENILTNNPSKSSQNNKINLDIKSINSRKNTDFKFINNTLSIEKNDLYNYQEIQINLPEDVASGVMYISLNKYDNLTVLNRFGKELAPRTITNFIAQPISKDTKAIILRFNVNEKKDISINEFYIAENSFDLDSIVYTKPIGINQELKEIGINTCDNYSDINSDISYEISINGGDYRAIRPLNKQKNLHLNSILAVDDSLTYYNLKQSIYNDNVNLYTTTDFKSTEVTIMKSFRFKLGTDIGLLTGKELNILLKEDLDLILNLGDVITVNGTSIEAKEPSFKVSLKKGFNTLSIPEYLWNQRDNMLQYEILEVSPTVLKLKSKATGEIINKLNDFNPNTSKDNSIFLQLVLKAEIFYKNSNEKLFYLNDRLYITKSGDNNGHVFIKHSSNFVNTVQLKINLKSLNKTSPVYLSSLTIRGV